MSTPVIERLVVEILTEHLDEDWAVPCEAGTDHEDALGCCGRNVATLILFPVVCCPGIKSRILWCQECTDQLLAEPFGVSCVDCDRLFKPASTAIRLIEPLNQRAT